MELFTALGINSTLFIQIGVFLVTFIFLKYLLFDPYFAAFQQRSKKTVGQVDEAEKYIAQTKAMEVRYTEQAKSINEEYKSIYDKTRTEAVKLAEEKTLAARNLAKEEVESAREKIAQAAAAAKNEIKKELPQMSDLISSRLLGKDLH